MTIGELPAMKDCPFCGIWSHPVCHKDEDEAWYVECSKCGRRTGNWLMPAAAIETWNGESQGRAKTPELKACPACGEVAQTYQRVNGTWGAKCTGCALAEGEHHTEEGAADAWNKSAETLEHAEGWGKKPMADLKACPFCGPGWNRETKSLGYTGWATQCQRCGAGTGVKATEAEAVEAWDRRPAEDMDPRRLQSLEAIIEIAYGRGWNGVENSKLLEVFIEAEFMELDRRIEALEEPEDGLKQAVNVLQQRLTKAEAELTKAKDLIYRLAQKAL